MKQFTPKAISPHRINAMKQLEKSPNTNWMLKPITSGKGKLIGMVTAGALESDRVRATRDQWQENTQHVNNFPHHTPAFPAPPKTAIISIEIGLKMVAECGEW